MGGFPGVCYFNPRPPCGGRHGRHAFVALRLQFQSTPPVWGATPDHPSPRAGRSISIHAPRVGGDRVMYGRGLGRAIFQSTPPVWGATRRTAFSQAFANFNPRPPCGGRLVELVQGRSIRTISIHAPRVGGDPARTALQLDLMISIHAPRVGGDRSTTLNTEAWPVFQSTPPVWGATWRPSRRFRCCIFQSTPPVWGATSAFCRAPRREVISIHAPRVGGDR